MPLILGANSVSGYTVKNSLRFNSGSTDNLQRTPSSASNRKTWTYSFWIKRSKLSTTQSFLSAEGGLTNFFFDDSDRIRFDVTTSGTRLMKASTRVFRDVSAWYHVVVAVDTTNATGSNRILIYVNGVSVDINVDVLSSGSPSQNSDLEVNNTVVHSIGMRDGTNDLKADAYFAEIYLINGQQLTPSSFGETDEDTGIWKPKAYTGTFGTNGFYLDFEDSANLGNDMSGNNNDFTVNNLTSIDQTTDTPTNNFATMNPLRQPTGNPATMTNGNLTVATNTSSGYYGGRSTIEVSSGKWYFEAKLVSYDTITGGIGIQNAESYTPEMFNSGQGAFAGYSSTGWTYYTSGPYTNNNTDTSYGNSFASGDIISVALDCDNAKLYFAKNGTWQNSGVPTSGATGTGAISITSGLTYLFAVDDAGSTRYCVWDCNFGNPPYSSGSNTDGAGYGNFSYAVPSGYYALCTKNLAQFG